MSDAWGPIVRLSDALASDGSLIEGAVRDVQVAVTELGRLDPGDIGRHTRALLVAALRAIAGRRGPTGAELEFVQELAVTRAQQGIPIEDVLTAIHIAQRHIWHRARQQADDQGVTPEMLMDARELFDDWSEQVRARLIVAHRRTEIGQARSERDRQVQLVHRILAGGSAAALAAAEAGVDPARPVWVVRARPSDAVDAADLERRLRSGPADLFARVDEDLVGVVADRPTADVAAGVGLGGPLPVDEADVAAGWAEAALDAAGALGLGGVREVSDVAVVAALRSRPDLGRALVDRHLGDVGRDEDYLHDVAGTVTAYLERDRNVDATAAALYVHPNTVRHRLKRFHERTGLRLESPFDAVAAWWLVRTWDGGG